VILDEGGHDERGILVEIYDDPQVSTRIEIAAIETLAPRDRVEPMADLCLTEAAPSPAL
jgi:hypothetical protein